MNYPKRIEILRNLLEYLYRARNDAEKYSAKEITQGIEEEYMNVLDEIREEGKLENKIEVAQRMREEGDSLDKILRITGLSEAQLRDNGIL